MTSLPPLLGEKCPECGGAGWTVVAAPLKSASPCLGGKVDGSRFVGAATGILHARRASPKYILCSVDVGVIRETAMTTGEAGLALALSNMSPATMRSDQINGLWMNAVGGGNCPTLSNIGSNCAHLIFSQRRMRIAFSRRGGAVPLAISAILAAASPLQVARIDAAPIVTPVAGVERPGKINPCRQNQRHSVGGALLSAASPAHNAVALPIHSERPFDALVAVRNGRFPNEVRKFATISESALNHDLFLAQFGGKTR